jgi:hypothetical protein
LQLHDIAGRGATPASPKLVSEILDFVPLVGEIQLLPEITQKKVSTPAHHRLLSHCWILPGGTNVLDGVRGIKEKH